MDEIQFACLPLYGKRILIVEDDDQLYCKLKDVLQDAGGEIIGALAHFPDMAPMIPVSHIDVALVDINWHDKAFAMLARELNARSIPLLLITAETSDELPASVPSKQRLRKPFTQQELLDGMLAAVYR